MTHDEFKKAIVYWEEKDKKSKHMPQDILCAEIEKYLIAHNTCALAVGSGDFVRCTPIEYTYRDGALWMFSEGGRKFRALEDNKNVSVAVYENFRGFSELNGMQISGIAEIVEPFTDEYIAAAKQKNIPLDALKKLPSPMNLIKITITHIDFLCSEFKGKGYPSRQSIDF